MASRFVLLRDRGRRLLGLNTVLSSRGPFGRVGCVVPRRLWAMLLLVAVAGECDAANRRWSGAAVNDDNFGTTANWVGGFVPGTLDVAQFGISGGIFQAFPYNVIFNNNVTNQALHIEDDLVTFNLSGRTYTVTTASGIVIGHQAGGFSGQLTVNNGTVSSSTNIDVGAAASTSGTLIVGANGLISGSPSLNIGKLGTGTLTVQSDGDISSTGSTTIGVGNGITGTATIIGNGTAGSATLLTGTLNVGSTGNGTVNVQLGGLLQNSGAAVVGTGSLFTGVGTGIVNVMNAGSVWNSLGLLEVGDGGFGEVNITLGGKVTGADNIVGANINGGGEVNVNGLNSLWDSSGTVTVGDLGAGALNITNQGVVENTDGVIGSAGLSTSTGTVDVIGAGSRWTNTDNLTVGNAGTGTLNVTAGGHVQNDLAYVGRDSSGTGTVTVNGVGSQWINTADLNVGRTGTGTLNIAAEGNVQNTSAIVGFDSSGMGAVTVVGSGSLWDNSSALTVGAFGEGTLSITGGGKVQNTFAAVGHGPEGFGLVTVDGDGSLWEISQSLTVGNFAQGTPNVNAGGTLNITGGGHVTSVPGSGGVNDLIGSQAGSSGLVTVDGVGSLWDSSGGIIVGDEGDGTLEITAGGIVQNIDGRVGGESTGTGHVTVDGSLWHNSGSLRVGNRGGGTLEITAGGSVESMTATIATVGGSTGMVTVDGDNSVWAVEEKLFVGDLGSATLNITGGGQVSCTDAIISNNLQSPNPSGTVTIAGANSTWEIGGRLAVGINQSFLGGGGTGTLRIQPGGTVNVTLDTGVSAGDLLSLEGGTLSTTAINFVSGGSVNFNFQWTSGTLHVERFEGDLVNQAGVLAPGNSLGLTEINGDYNQLADATLEIEIGGTATHDFVSVFETAFLGGDLALVLINGFVPSSTDTFSVLRASLNLFNAFANVANGQRLSTSDGLGSFVVNYGAGSAFAPDSVYLSNFLAAAIPGDYNQNGTVDTADFTVWRDHLGQSFTLTNENPAAATPGVVDAEDYAFWKAHFGVTTGSGSGATAGLPSSADSAVPEPATYIYLVVASAGFFAAARRQVSTTRDQAPCGIRRQMH